jgi:hypothetical protein
MKDLPIRDQAIAYLTVEGWTNDEIATCLNVMPEAIRLKLTDEKILEKMRALQYSLYAEDSKKRFEDILPFAIDALEDIIKNPSVKPQTKMQAVTDCIDRVLGKPKQTVEHEGGLLRAFYERLNNQGNNADAIEADFKEIPEDNKRLANPNEVIAPHQQIKKNPNLNEDFVDSWMKQNLK